MSQEMHPAVCSGDFRKILGLKKERNLPDHERYLALKKHFVSSTSYKLPCRIINKKHN